MLYLLDHRATVGDRNPSAARHLARYAGRGQYVPCGEFRSRSPGRYAVFALKHQEAIKRVLQPLEDMFQDHDRLKGGRGLEFKLQGKIIGNSSLSTSCGR